MSVDIRINQKGLMKKKLDLAFVNEICMNHDLNLGIPNEAFAVNEYYGDDDITNIELVLYNPMKLGRGFTFLVAENKNDCSLRVNNPSTADDIGTFFKVVKYVMDELKADTYIRDDSETVKASELAYEEELITKWNEEQLFETINRDDDLTIYGAKYPIAIEPETIQHFRSVDRAVLMDEFADYLDQKQEGDYFYIVPEILTNDKEEFLGSYPIPEGVETIFPLTPSVPLIYGIDTIKVDYWRVSVGMIVGNGYVEGANVEFSEFIEKCQIAKKPHFDNNNVIVKITKLDIENLVK